MFTQVLDEIGVHLELLDALAIVLCPAQFYQLAYLSCSHVPAIFRSCAR